MYGKDRTEIPDFWLAVGMYPDVLPGQELLGQLLSNNDYKALLPLYFYRTDFLRQNRQAFRDGEPFTSEALRKAERAMHIPAVLCYCRVRKGMLLRYGRNYLLYRHPVLKEALRNCYKPLKRAVRRLHPKLDDECRSIISTLKDTNKPGISRIITLNVPRYGNRGDIAIALAERRLFNEHCRDRLLIELPFDLCDDYPHLIIPHINSRDILMTVGGGWYGSFWRNAEMTALNILRHFPNNRVIIMPQTIYYFDSAQGRKELADDRKSFARFKDLHVFVRDRKSFEMIHSTNLFPNAQSVDLVPDMACSMDFTNLAPEKREGVLVCLRPDVEQVLTNHERNTLCVRLLREFGHVGFFSTNPVRSTVMLSEWEKVLDETLRMIAGAELVITDRLHGMLFAAITGTPCVAFDNKTGKVHSVHEWISGCEYVQVCRSAEEFDGAVKKALSSPRKWDNSELLPYFNKILSLIS
ncbi:MAG: polysaccharide pyruvyl transferase family protein [Synergistaceae bacterium]|nr:polysaccharide pyruvyl transferase family protein [Synergistaceae bacterium]